MTSPLCPWFARLLSISAALGLCLPAQVAAQQIYTVQAFAGAPRSVGDGGPATRALLWSPRGVAVDRSGNLLIADTGDDLVRRVAADGTITTIAGNLYDVPGGDNGGATQALLSFPYRVAVGSNGDLYVADASNNRVRRVSRDGIITTVAGNGTAGWSGDGGPATQAELSSPRDVALDSHGNIYILDTNNSRVRCVTPAGTIQNFAGNGLAGFSGDGGPADQAQLNYPLGIAIDASNNLYIADTSNHRIRMVAPDSTISTIAGSVMAGYGGDNQPAAFGILNQPSGVAVDGAGNLYVADSGNHRVRKIVLWGNIVTVAGNGTAGFGGDNGAASAALLNTPRGVGVDAAGNLYIADTENHRVRRVTPQGILTTVAGSDTAEGDNGPAAAARFLRPSGLALDAAGNLYIADTNNHRIRRVSGQGVVTTVAGTGVAGYGGDGGQATQAQLNQPNGLAFDSLGNLCVADSGNHAIRCITPRNVISTAAGIPGEGGNDGDDGPAVQAHLLSPNGLAFDKTGNLYIADSGNNRVRRVGSDGRIRSFAGDSNGGYEYNGDNIPAQGATLNFPFDVVVDSRNNVYVADFLNCRVRRIDALNGVITTVAGGGASPGLDLPIGLALDGNGNLYIADSLNQRIQMLAANGVLRAIAGAGAAGDAGDGGAALSAYLSGPRSIAVDGSGSVYFSDQDNHRIRVLKPEVTAIRAVTNAASGVGGAVAPGEMVTLEGTLLGPAGGAYGQIAGGQLGTSAGPVRVLFDGVAAPVLAALPGQVNAIVPYSVGGTTAIQAEVSGQLSAPFVLPVADAAPGIFTADGSGQGQAAASNQDGSSNSAANPAARGSVVTLYVTGEGQTNPPGVNGKIAGDTLPQPILKVTAGVGGALAQVIYAGAAPAQPAGVMQVNLRVPDGVSPGAAVAVSIAVGSYVSPAGVTIAVK